MNRCSHCGLCEECLALTDLPDSLQKLLLTFPSADNVDPSVLSDADMELLFSDPLP